MLKRSKIVYIPSLRMKKGELEGLKALRGDVADCVLPLLIVPPAGERDSSSQVELFSSNEAIPDVGGVLLKYWPRRQIFIDTAFLLKEHGIENASNWLPGIFTRARSLDVIAIPTASLTDLEKMNVAAFRESLSPSQTLKFGLRILSGEMTDPNLKERIQAVLSAMDLTTTECATFADFSDADISDHSLVAPIIQSALEQLQDFGQWQHIVFQGTHYPDKNPADPGQTISHPRNEWRAWRDAVKFDPSTAEHMVFGDFAADCAKVDFGGQGGRPIPHCRYTTESHWLVVRGNESGSQYEIMKNVYDRVLNSGQFSGPSFSEADEYIYDVARNNLDSAGNAATWRQVNTTHHITRVVADIAKVRGIQITEIPNAPIGAQLALLDSAN
jgi:hypothetical protein